MASAKSVVVVGLGTFGAAVAAELASLGHDVLGIDRDAERVRAMAETLSHAVQADAQDPEALREAGAGECDAALVAIGEDLEMGAMALSNLQDIGLRDIWVKALTPTHGRILERLGATRVVRPEEEMGRHVARALHAPGVGLPLALPGGRGTEIACLRLPSSLAGRTFAEIGGKMDDARLRLLGALLEDGRLLSPEEAAGTRAAPGASLVAVGPRAALLAFAGEG